MKFRTGLVLGAIAGYAIGSRMVRREQEEGGTSNSIVAAMSRHPSAQRLSDRGRHVIDLAGGRGTEAIRRARASLQRRLDSSSDDLSMN